MNFDGLVDESHTHSHSRVHYYRRQSINKCRRKTEECTDTARIT